MNTAAQDFQAGLSGVLLPLKIENAYSKIGGTSRAFARAVSSPHGLIDLLRGMVTPKSLLWMEVIASAIKSERIITDLSCLSNDPGGVGLTFVYSQRFIPAEDSLEPYDARMPFLEIGLAFPEGIHVSEEGNVCRQPSWFKENNPAMADLIFTDERDEYDRASWYLPLSEENRQLMMPHIDQRIAEHKKFDILRRVGIPKNVPKEERDLLLKEWYEYRATHLDY